MTLNMEAQKTNGDELPASRQAAVEAGLAFFQETAAERDALRDEVRQLKLEIAAQKEATEALRGILNFAESRVNTATLVRDEAVGKVAQLEAVLASMLALGRAFEIKSAPLVRSRDEDEVFSIGGA